MINHPSQMANYFFNLLFTIFLTITYFITSATTTLLSYPNQDVGGYWALAGAIASWLIVMLCFGVTVYETATTNSLFDSTIWAGLIMSTLLSLMIVVAIMSIVAIVIIKSSGRERDIEVAFADCIFSAFLSLGAIVMVIAILVIGAQSSLYP
jgi:hypothetical protein